MTRKKEINIEGLSNKEILISFCNTLGDASCKRAYKLLREEFDIDRSKSIRLNKYGVIDPDGKVRMTSTQYKKMVEECGEYKFTWLIGCLHDYIDYLKQQAELGDTRCKRQLKIYLTTSSYPRLMKGWVMERYNQYGCPPPDTEQAGRVDFYKIDTYKQAEEYVRSIPFSIFAGSPEMDFLLSKYPELIKVIEEIKE